jgi:cephalosporin-C deacetylase-like acetyl esterase
MTPWRWFVLLFPLALGIAFLGVQGLRGMRRAVLAQTVVEVVADHADGRYRAGETAVWRVSVNVFGRPAIGSLSWRVQRGGLKIVSAGRTDLNNGQATVVGSLDEAGTLLLTAAYQPTGLKKAEGLGGAVFDPDDIRVSAPVPDDFDAFWDAKLAELASVPMNARIEPVDIGDPGIEYAHLTLDNVRCTKIHGQMAKPRGAGHLPAMLTVEHAGVFPLQPAAVVKDARRGRLCLDIESHDVPIDQPAAFYARLGRTTLADYQHQGREDRESSYFLRMYLSCRRAVDWLTRQPEWDGRHLLVTGVSQGGGQAIVAAGLHPAVTALSAMVPALCDHTGQLIGRAPGWPQLCGEGEKPNCAAALQTARYFDAANFAHRVKARHAMVGAGLLDTACPPAGVIATYNLLPGRKQLVLMPRSGHVGPMQQPDWAARNAAWVDGVLAN